MKKIIVILFIFCGISYATTDVNITGWNVVDGTFYGDVVVAGNVGIGTTNTDSVLNVHSISGMDSDDYVFKISSYSTGVILFGVHPNGHLSVEGSTSTLGVCLNGTIDANVKMDTAGRVMFSGLNSSCGIIFGSVFDADPVCVCTSIDAGNDACAMRFVSVSSVVFVSATNNWDNGDSLNYICLGAH